MDDWLNGDSGLDTPVEVSEDAGIGDVGPESLTEDGVAQEFDTDANGVVDLFVEGLANGAIIAVSDENGDRVADTFGLDLNADGAFELMVTRDGDVYHLMADDDGDGVFETETDMTRDSLLAVDSDIIHALDMQFGVPDAQSPDQVDQAIPAEVSEPVYVSPYVDDGQLVGDPVGDSEHWFEQAVNGFCVPASVTQIVAEYTGLDFQDEQHFVERANELKVFEVGPDGVPGVGVDGALALLEDAGIPAAIEFGDGVGTLVEYLDEGRGVILAIDSGEIWYGEQSEDNMADHAVVVTGVDLTRGTVIVSDPGDPGGNAKEYPIAQFDDAWADSGYAAIVCDATPEDFQSGAGEGQAPTEVVVPRPEALDESGQVSPGPDPGAGIGATELISDLPSTPSAVDWAVQHSWAILPVLLGGRLVAGMRRTK